MGKMTIQDKLALLSDAAKYDASCASSGTSKRGSRDGKGLGSTTGSGICHAYAPDGRCISLLKILMTNYCVYDCAYCVNRVSSNVPRARFTVEEVVWLTSEFYRRNYIEGLFLSSGIIKSSDYTMEEMVRIAEKLREGGFRGYIHLKTIPEASPELIERAGLVADRLSINIELPTDASVKAYAPEKDPAGIRQAMGKVRLTKEDYGERSFTGRRRGKFAPAGQSTQMIVGADDANDATILGNSTRLYGSYGLKRVYYSAFSPIPDSSAVLPLVDPPLMREHRLYQADWLLRFYDFSLDEIVTRDDGGMLDLDVDPKLAWALANRERFPVDVNRAEKALLLRVPGFGTKIVDRILKARRSGAVGLEDIRRMGGRVKAARPFIVTRDHHPGGTLDQEDLRARFVKPKQMELF
ncbi:putative DNA modification/repair radical SAM protein [Jannaschia pagri]|uniref:DNA modification/repair radical SAM protein n=1 Tax=Jannaschia pagri TaxID=2829797 RepID=A0ABQ4NI58_9RHOB|nr:MULTISPECIES: putative DNA modification/repair radical SAM protein [unclassified Jannaschia]GIT89777.1 putative DNA modification/repair radical SAM protein [Jannaschia sp. AI_61]GIT94115.1 putative DNA modification/repair radical SAM protein [Jannaschia sp. AI_62]